MAFLLKNKFLLIGIAVGLVAIALVWLNADRQATPTLEPTSATTARRAQPTPLLVSKQRFGDWRLDCVRGPRGNTGCALVLFVVDQAHKHILLRLSVVERDGPKMLVLTPPNAFIPAGFTLTPDNGPAITAPFDSCLPGSCRALFALTAPEIKALESAPGAQVHFVTGRGRSLTYHVPTAGFSAGYTAWAALYAEPKAAKHVESNAAGQSKTN